MKENRVSVRVAEDYLILDAKVSVDEQNWTSVYARDLSDRGMGFTMKEEFAMGTQLMMEGSVSGVGDKGRTLDISCKIKIIFAGKSPDGKCLYGCKFLDLEQMRGTELSMLIERLVTKFPSLEL